MSWFIDALVATARGSSRGLVTGAPAAPHRRTWGEVHQQARQMAGELVDRGLTPGSAVAVLSGEPALIAPAIQAVWLAGGSVTMLHQPTQRTDLAHWAQDTQRVLTMIDAKLVLLGAPFEAIAPVLEERGISYRLLAELGTGQPLADPVCCAEDAPALLQLTSGSTADPKAVLITHANLLANLNGMADAAGLDSERDTMVSWLPLFHDMGMVGFLILPMIAGVELVKATPTDFLTGPLMWAELLSRYRGTVTAAPNFAYAVLARRLVSAAEDGAYDLSRLRVALNGAEPIDVAAVRDFTAAGARFGMPAECVLAAYGMAEATLAVSFAPVFTGLAVDTVDAEELEAHGQATPARDGVAARSFSLLGPPLRGLEVSVVDEHGGTCAEREVGELRVRGDSVTPGYLTTTGPSPTQDSDGWLATGDLGYLVDGQVVVCGRRKDVIIMGGRNIYPTDIERAATSVKGVRAGNAVAVRLDAGTKRERFAVALESTVAGDDEAERLLVKEVAARIMDEVGFRPISVVVLRPGSLPKTPSGKLRRAAAGELVNARTNS